MGELRPWHIAVLVVVLILLFGSKRLPDAARGLGRSMRILKAETKGLADDDAPTAGRPASGPVAGASDTSAPGAGTTETVPGRLTTQQVTADKAPGAQTPEPSAARGLDG